MSGTVIKRGKTWSAVYDAPTDPQGHRKQVWKGGYPTKKEAGEALVGFLNSITTGDYVEPSKLTVGEYLDRVWLPAVESQLRPSTFASYRMIVATQLKPRVGAFKLQRLNAPQLNAAYAEMLATGKRDGKRGLSARSVRYAHAVTRKALADAVRWDMVARNVAEGATPPKPVKPEKRTWTADQLRTFLGVVRDDRLYAAWQLMAMTGMRRGEVLGLAWRDVDLDRGKLTVRQSLVTTNYQLALSQPKTKRSVRTIALDAGTVAVLRTHRAKQAQEKLAMGGDWGNKYDLLFTREDGVWVHPQRFSCWFSQHMKAAGLPTISVHCLRHTYATVALRAGVHAKVVSERLGHATVSFTLDTYTDALPDMQEDAAEMVAQLVLGAAR